MERVEICGADFKVMFSLCESEEVKQAFGL